MTYSLMAIQKHAHRGTGKIRLVYVKDETITIEGEVKLDSKGKIQSVFGKAEMWLDDTDGRHPNNCFNDNNQFVNDGIDPKIPLEFDPIKQRFCYVVDENGHTFEDWSYWQYDKYKQLLSFTGKTHATCS